MRKQNRRRANDGARDERLRHARARLSHLRSARREGSVVLERDDDDERSAYAALCSS